MKKIVISLLIILSIVLSTVSISTYIKLNNFESSEVKDTIEYICSDAFQGRLGGTLGNSMVANYIKNEFKAIGLEPLNNNYYQSFTIKCPQPLDNTPLLSVIDKDGKIVKTYDYGVNYKESLLNFRINEIEFNSMDIKNKNTNGFFVWNSSTNSNAIFITTLNNSLSFRSSFFENSDADLYIHVTKETLDDINSYLDEGYSVYTYIPYEVQEVTLNNVVGTIKGSNPNLPSLVLGAHFDHVGTDLGGNIYNGALDNASGTAFLLELAKYIKNLGTPDRNIIFVAFNGEELGLKGSTAFAKEYEPLLKGSRVYNFDMIGSYDGVPLCIMSGASTSVKSPLVDEVATVMKESKIYFNYLFQDASDHVPFIDIGVEAVTLCDNDTSRIHTPNDRIEYISEIAIDRCFSIMKVFIVKDAYSDKLIYTNFSYLIIASALSTSTLVIIFTVIVIKKRNYKKKGI